MGNLPVQPAETAGQVEAAPQGNQATGGDNLEDLITMDYVREQLGDVEDLDEEFLEQYRQILLESMRDSNANKENDKEN